MFSVVTPAFNAEKYIAQAIESVQTQGFDAWEIIVVDDGSTDRTCEIVSEIAARDSRVRLIQNRHGGVSHARNTGVSHARYEWIALLDADDAFCPDKMKKQFAAAMENPDVVLWGTYAYNVGENGERYDVSEDGPRDQAAYNRIRETGGVLTIKNSSALFRAELFRSLGGFDSQYDSTEDTELWNRMAELGPVVAIPEPLILYRFHFQSLSVRKFVFQYDCLQFIRARNRLRLRGKDIGFTEFLETYRNRPYWQKAVDTSILYSNAYWRFAGIQMTNGKRLQGIGWMMRAFAMNPPMILWRLVRKIIGRLRYR